LLIDCISLPAQSTPQRRSAPARAFGVRQLPPNDPHAAASADASGCCEAASGTGRCWPEDADGAAYRLTLAPAVLGGAGPLDDEHAETVEDALQAELQGWLCVLSGVVAREAEHGGLDATAAASGQQFSP
jgi:hypothetical protein